VSRALRSTRLAGGTGSAPAPSPIWAATRPSCKMEVDRACEPAASAAWTIVFPARSVTLDETALQAAAPDERAPPAAKGGELFSWRG
jgi:hypothetical protein